MRYSRHSKLQSKQHSFVTHSKHKFDPHFLRSVLQPEREVSDADRAQEDATRRAFTKVAGEDMEIDAYELMDIVNSAFSRGMLDVSNGLLVCQEV